MLGLAGEVAEAFQKGDLFEGGSDKVTRTSWSLILCYKGIFHSKLQASKQLFLSIFKAVRIPFAAFVITRR